MVLSKVGVAEWKYLGLQSLALMVSRGLLGNTLQRGSETKSGLLYCMSSVLDI